MARVVLLSSIMMMLLKTMLTEGMYFLLYTYEWILLTISQSSYHHRDRQESHRRLLHFSPAKELLPRMFRRWSVNKHSFQNPPRPLKTQKPNNSHPIPTQTRNESRRDVPLRLRRHRNRRPRHKLQQHDLLARLHVRQNRRPRLPQLHPPPNLERPNPHRHPPPMRHHRRRRRRHNRKPKTLRLPTRSAPLLPQHQPHSRNPMPQLRPSRNRAIYLLSFNRLKWRIGLYSS